MTTTRNEFAARGRDTKARPALARAGDGAGEIHPHPLGCDCGMCTANLAEAGFRWCGLCGGRRLRVINGDPKWCSRCGGEGLERVGGAT